MAYIQPFPARNPAALKAGPKGPVAPVLGPDLSVHLMCPECAPNKPEIIEEFGSGDLVCGGCGLVLGDKIVDTRSEWRTFANDEGDDPSRVGAASNPLDGPETFETSISFRDGNSGISRELQRAAARASTKTEKTLSTAYQEISHLCDKIQLGKNITDTAKQLFKRASEEGVLRGKKEEAIIAACVFIACRMGKSPRTFKEICTLTNVPKKVLGQCYKALERAFEVKASGNGSIESPATNVPSSYISAPSTSESSSSTSYDPSAPILMVAPGISQSAYDNASSESETLVISQMLPRFISNLGLTKLSGFQSATLHVLICGKALGLIDGRSPLTVVGSLLYFMCHLWGAGKSPKEICAVVDTTEGTIRARYKDLVDRKDVLVKKEWLESGKADLERLPR